MSDYDLTKKLRALADLIRGLVCSTTESLEPAARRIEGLQAERDELATWKAERLAKDAEVSPWPPPNWQFSARL